MMVSTNQFIERRNAIGHALIWMGIFKSKHSM